MAQRGLREYDAKRLFFSYAYGTDYECALISRDTDIDKLPEKYPWLAKKGLVAKPDQLFGKRGKNNLVLLNKSWNEAKQWIRERLGKEAIIGNVEGTLTHFLVEPFIPHSKEYYLSFVACRSCDHAVFSEYGGMEIEENMDMAKMAELPLTEDGIEKKIASMLPKGREADMKAFVLKAYGFFRKYGLSYLEFNPFILHSGKFAPLDVVAKMDDTALLNNGAQNIEFPSPFGRELTKEEALLLRTLLLSAA